MSDFNVKAKVRGLLQIQKRDINTGEIYFDTGEFPNTILNGAFTTGGLGPTFSRCWCASDSSVSATDTTVTGPLGSSATVSTSVLVTTDGTEVTQTQTRTFTFTAGSIVGNISSIGLNQQTTNTQMFIKSLIKDVNGDPTTISSGATDQVIVIHKLITIWHEYENLGVINIDGVDYTAELYNTVAMVNSYFSPYYQRINSGGGYWYLCIHGDFTPPTLPVTPTETSYVSGLNTPAFSKSLGNPSANNTVAGEDERYWNYTIAANSNINTSDPISAISIKNNLSNSYSMAVKFTPPLPKNNTISYTFRFGLKLARS